MKDSYFHFFLRITEAISGIRMFLSQTSNLKKESGRVTPHFSRKPFEDQFHAQFRHTNKGKIAPGNVFPPSFS